MFAPASPGSGVRAVVSGFGHGPRGFRGKGPGIQRRRQYGVEGKSVSNVHKGFPKASGIVERSQKIAVPHCYGSADKTSIAHVPGTPIVLQETKVLLAMALPLILQNFAQMSSMTMVMTSVGQLGAQELAAASMAMSVYYISGLAIVYGLAAPCETLCSQAFGAKDYKKVGVVLQTSLFAVAVFVAVTILCWSQTERFLLLIGQDPTISSMAAHYLTLLCPTFVFASLSICVSKYMIAQRSVLPMVLSSICSLLLCPALLKFCMVTTGLGFSGAPITVSLLNLVSIAVLCLWAALRNNRQRGTQTHTFHGWTLESFKGLGDYMKTALPITGVVCCEWWAYELLQVSAGWLPNPHLTVGAMGISNCMANIIYILPAGITNVSTARISNELGAKRPSRAVLIAKICLFLMFFCLVSACLAQVLFKERIAVMWTTDIALQKLAVRILPLVGVTEVFSGIGTFLYGILRAYDRGKAGLRIVIISHWLIGLPLAITLGFPLKLGVVGFWWGLFAGAVIEFVCFLWMLKDVLILKRPESYVDISGDK